MNIHAFVRRVAVMAAIFGLSASVASAQVYGGYGGGYNGGYGGGYDRRDRDDVRGVVTSFDHFDLYVQTGYGNRYVHLHQGTVINPTGATLRNGMDVRIDGYRDRNGTLEANEIDVVGWEHHHEYH